jgi:putative transposase
VPSRNVVKIYVKDGYYHVYNRGVERRTIFEDNQDYGVFLNRLKEALTPLKEEEEQLSRRQNYARQIRLVAYCLMPNHFHLLIQQTDQKAMESFMRTLATSYSMYFNKKYERVGRLFQGSYKAVQVDSDEYLMHLSRYIHLNPRAINQNYQSYDYSSYRFYFQPQSWLKPGIVLGLFGGLKEYEEFVADPTVDSDNLLGDITLED